MDGERLVRKIIAIFIVFLFLFLCFSMVAQSGRIQIWPGKLWITINEWPSENKEVRFPKIQVTNPQSYGINVSAKIDHPNKADLEEVYSYIPDLSWIKTVPEVLYIPAGSSGEFEVIVDVPEDEQSLHFNENWLTLVTVYSKMEETPGSFNFQIELGVKLFIKTPEGELAEIQPIHIFFFFFILIIIIYLAFSSIKKKKSDNAVFYFKKKK